MPRDLPIGNGSLLVNFDHTGQIRDIYWPHVGQENHTSGHVCRMGIWVNGHFSWLGDPGWERTLSYHHHSLITHIQYHNSSLGVQLTFRDGVDFHKDLMIRQCTLANTGDHPLEVRLFFCQDLTIYGTTVGDSAYYEPDTNMIFHYKGKRWFAMGIIRGEPGNWQSNIDQWAIGNKNDHTLEGTWRDAEDGMLSGNSVGQGRIDSAIGAHIPLDKESQSLWYFLIPGSDFHAIRETYDALFVKGPQTYLDRTEAYWQLWANKNNDKMAHLPEHLTSLYRHSLLILRTQIDNQGAIIAANDFDIALFNRDTYSYMWPRDGALVAATLIDAGYSEITRRFFDFCHRVITDDGFLLHKYTPDGSLASSWHHWYGDGQKQLPIQEDETALVLWALWRHFEAFRDIEFIKNHYRGLVIRAGCWLSEYVDETYLPQPSWDLWEERYGIHSWTVAATWAGLQAAANFASAFGENPAALQFRRAASKMKLATKKLLWSASSKSYMRSIIYENSRYYPDKTADASLVGLWYFGMFAADDPLIVQTMEKLEAELWVQTKVGGMARYKNDYYHQISQDIDRIPGNPWFICTLWLAQWYIAIARKPSDLEKPEQLLEWTAERTLPSGVMAEQVHPETNQPLSVSPLTWSHATYIATIIDFNKKYKELTQDDNQ